jgi:hypothetical protein
MVLRSARGDPRRFAQRMLTRPVAQQALIADLRESYRQGTTVMAADLLRYRPSVGFPPR